MAKDFLRVEEIHGCGEKSNLSRHKLECLQRACDPFRKLLEQNCDNYALYRCTLTAHDGVIYAVLSGADDNGNLSEIQFAYNMVNGEVYKRKIAVRNEAKVGQELYNLVLTLLKLVPVSVGMLDFPVEGKFLKGRLMDYNKEPGTVLITIDDSLDNDYFLG